MQNCKDDVRKQICSNIVQIAMEIDCKVIVLERLNNQVVKTNSRKENFMAAFWSVKKFQDTLVNSAAWHDIEVVFVSEKCTSLVSNDTGSFGYRYRQNFWYEKDGNIKVLNADINAAKNILKKAITRHAWTHQVCIEKIFNEEGYKCDKGFLTNEFGNLNTAQKFFLPYIERGEKYVYKHEGEWITQADKKQIAYSIESQVASGEVVDKTH